MIESLQVLFDLDNLKIIVFQNSILYSPFKLSEQYFKSGKKYLI